MDNNQRKLELALCALLPYAVMVKLENFNKIIQVESYGNGMHATDGKPYVEAKQKVYTLDIVKPILHSMDKLSEPVLMGGLIPILELTKLSLDWDGLEKRNDYEFIIVSNTIELRVKTHLGMIHQFAYCYSDNSFAYYLNGNCITTPKQLELFEQLKKWHFNLFDLPKEMYIEKSESNGNNNHEL